MSTIRARSRASRAATSTGPFDDPPAASRTWSAPSPLLAPSSARSSVAMPASSADEQAIAPAFSAIRHRSSTVSMPKTRTPAATSNRTTS
jgi:hypothetical protein